MILVVAYTLFFNRYTEAILTCQGSTLSSALLNCPDQGQLQSSSGGNVTLTIRNATNLPANDNLFGSTDAYIKIIMDERELRTKVIKGSTSPVWNEPISLGYMQSAASITLEVWYTSPGFDFIDKLALSSNVRIPFCSSITAAYSSVPCTSKYALCRSTNSLWRMPIEQHCEEEAIIPFGNTLLLSCLANSTIPCLSIAFDITPFAIKVLPSTNTLTNTPVITAAAIPNQDSSWTYNFGRPYLNSISMLDMRIREASSLLGGLMLRLPDNDKYIGSANSLKFQLSINFPAVIYVCRRESDNNKGIPSWLFGTYSRSNLTATRLLFIGESDYYGCFYSSSAGTYMNEYDEVIDNSAVDIYSNTIKGHDNTDPLFYSAMFIIIAVPILPTYYTRKLSFMYSSSPFIISLLTYGMATIWFTYLTFKYLHKILFKTDRILNRIRIIGLDASSTDIISYLFYVDNLVPSLMKSRLFYTHMSTLLCLSLSLISLLPLSLRVIHTVTPVSLGYGLLFIGSAFMLWSLGFNMWRYNQWRLTSIIISAFAVGAFMFIAFLFSIIFADPSVIQLGKSINFTALSLTICLINTAFYLPCLLNEDERTKTTNKEILQSFNKLMSSTDRECSTVVDFHQFVQIAVKEFHIDKSDNFYCYSDFIIEYNFPTRMLYILSVVVLILYNILIATMTPYYACALLNSLTILFFDYIHRSLSHSILQCSLGVQVFLCVFSRLLIMGGSPVNFLFFYSSAYFLYATLLCVSILNYYLPVLSSKEAALEIISRKPALLMKNDLSRDPFVALVSLTVYFIWIVLLSDIGHFFSVSTQSYSYPVLGIMLPIIISLLYSTAKCIYLDSKHLLRGWFRTGFFAYKFVNVSLIFAILSELSLISTGLIIYGILGYANIVIISAVFIPMILLALLITVIIWYRNDYRLVKWPPSDLVLELEKSAENSAKQKDKQDHVHEFDDVENFQNSPEYDELLKYAEANNDGIEKPESPPNLELKSTSTVYKKMPKLPVKSAFIIELLQAQKNSIDRIEEKLLKTIKPMVNLDVEDSENEEEDAITGEISFLLRSYSEKKEKRVWFPFLNSIFLKLPRMRLKIANADPLNDIPPETTELAGRNNLAAIIPLRAIPNLYLAFFAGYLTHYESAGLVAFVSVLLLLAAYGLTVSAFVTPRYLGHFIWILGCNTFIFTFHLTSYIFSYRVNLEAIYSYYLIFFLHLGFCAYMYLVEFRGVLHSKDVFWLMDFCLITPALAVLIHHFWLLKDEGIFFYACSKEKFIKYRVTYVTFFAVVVATIALFAGISVQIYYWVDHTFGLILITIDVFISIKSLFFFFWTQFSPLQFFKLLDNSLSISRNIVAAVTIIALLMPNPLFILCIAIYLSIFQSAMVMIPKLLSSNHSKLYFFSPYFFPSYSYDLFNNKVNDENRVATYLVYILGLLLLLGSAVSIFFYDPVVGTSIISITLLLSFSLFVYLVNLFPYEIRMFHQFLSSADVMNASKTAALDFIARKEKINFDPSLITLATSNELMHTCTCRSSLKALRRESYLLRYGDKMETDGGLSGNQEFDINRLNVLHSQAHFTVLEAFAEIILNGGGPFGFLGFGGILSFMLRSTPLHRFEPQFLQKYACSATLESSAVESRTLNIHNVSLRISEADEDIDSCYKEEYRTSVNFLFRLVLSLQSVTTQRIAALNKFLRENRMKLKSNNLKIPSQLYTIESFSNIDYNVALVWLSTLKPKKCTLFYEFYDLFMESHRKKDQNFENYEKIEGELLSSDLIKRKAFERLYQSVIKANHQRMYLARLQFYSERLYGDEATEFITKSKVWTLSYPPSVPEEDMPIYYSFVQATKLDDDPLFDSIKYELGDILNSRRHCVADANGRSSQFIDPSFNICEYNKTAKSSKRLCANVSLFGPFIDSRDIFPGQYRSEWILYAIGMLVRRAESVNDAIRRLFVVHNDEIGFYSLRLMLDQSWVPVVLDDMFPVMNDQKKWNNSNRGIATAHSHECSRLWISLIEKSFAKIYGEYERLSGGFIQHALRTLTGCDVDTISIRQISRSSNLYSFWEDIVRNHGNGFILGAQSVPEDFAGNQLLDMGMKFKATYTILDVKDLDGAKLILLRAPGDCITEWRGDWSDNSMLWTNRKKYKLNYLKADDNLFWMKLEDFCDVFQYLYICKVFDDSKWKRLVFEGKWKKDIQITYAPVIRNLHSSIRAPLVKAEKIFTCNTAGGLSQRNLFRNQVQNNPFFLVQIFEDSEVHFSLKQVSQSSGDPSITHPAGIYILKSDGVEEYQRPRHITNDNLIAGSGLATANRVINLDCVFVPGSYFLVAALLHPGVEAFFKLSLVFNREIAVTQIWPPLAGFHDFDKWINSSNDSYNSDEEKSESYSQKY